MTPVSPSWLALLGQRLPRHSFIKATGTMTFMVLFFWGYFAVMRHPLGPATEMPLTAIDAWISPSPLAFPVYASLWVYVSIPPALFSRFRTLALFGFWIALLCLVCLAIFWIWPTTIPAFSVDWSGYPGMALIKGVDAGGNACPSLHVASAAFAAIWLDRLLRGVAAPAWLRGVNGVQCAAIIWSTMATRQHVFLDVAAGLAAGLLFAALSLYCARRDPDIQPRRA
jgi:membrane-associated phospholipid phosphatase